MEHPNEISGPQRIVVIGGNAGGTSFVAQARRRSQAEIILIERGPYIGYASCGLPYYLSGTIPQRDTLLPLSPGLFGKRFGVDVRTGQEALAINRDSKTIEIGNGKAGRYLLNYDKLAAVIIKRKKMMMMRKRTTSQKTGLDIYSSPLSIEAKYPDAQLSYLS